MSKFLRPLFSGSRFKTCSLEKLSDVAALYYYFEEKLAWVFSDHGKGSCLERCQTCMLRTKVFALSGFMLIAYPLILGGGVWGYQRTVWMLQTGILSLGLGLFFRLIGTEDRRSVLAMLYDLEG